MATAVRRQSQEDLNLSTQLLKARLLTEGQLKAALDYQRSLGGKLQDVVVKLNLARASQVEDLLAGREVKPAADAQPADAVEEVLDPTVVDSGRLQVHRRLLGRLPRDLVEERLIVLFFPAGKMSQRRIILGHGREVTPAIREKVHSCIGVRTCSLALDPEEAISFLEGNGFPALRRTIDRAEQTGQKVQPEAPAEPSAPQEPDRETPPPAGVPGLAENAGELAEGASSGGEQEDLKLAAEKAARDAAEAAAAAEVATREVAARGSRLAPETECREPDRRPALQEVSGWQQAQGTAPPSAAENEAGSAQAASDAPASAEDRVTPPVAGENVLLRALVTLLAKKGLISREELDVEVELARIRRKAGTMLPAEPFSETTGG